MDKDNQNYLVFLTYELGKFSSDDSALWEGKTNVMTDDNSFQSDLLSHRPSKTNYNGWKASYWEAEGHGEPVDTLRFDIGKLKDMLIIAQNELTKRTRRENLKAEFLWDAAVEEIKKMQLIWHR